MISFNAIHTVPLPSSKALAVAVKENRCAAGDRDGFIHIIDTQSGQIVRRLRQHVEFVYTLAFNPDNGHLVSAGKDKSIREWDIESGNMIIDYAGIFSSSASAKTMASQKFKPGTRSHTMTILTIALDKNGLMGTGSQDNRAKLWKNGEPVRTYDWHTAPVTAVRFQPETHVFFSASKDKTIRSWDDVTGSLIHKYTGHLGEIVALDFIDAHHFVSCDNDGNVIGWNVDKESPEEFIYTSSNRLVCAHFHKASQCLLLGCENGTLEVLDLSGGVAKVSASCTAQVHQIDVRCIHSNGDLVASCDNAGKVVLWNLTREA